ncbi:MAG: glycerol-3-phosphate 1-O-acyltransferase PlsY [Candidatus Omnitrophota bacterium]
MVSLIIGLVLSYLCGAIPAAYLFAKFVKGVDIREQGSGNVGATNALRVLGKLPGFLVLTFDILKGVFAVLVISRIFAESTGLEFECVQAIFGGGAVCGHVFNVFLKMKSGKGVATSAGVLLALSPLSVSIGFLFFLAVVGITRIVSLGSIIASIVIPFCMLFLKVHYSFIVLSGFLCIIIVAKHKSNIYRLLTGRERKVFEKK